LRRSPNQDPSGPDDAEQQEILAQGALFAQNPDLYAPVDSKNTQPSPAAGKRKLSALTARFGLLGLVVAVMWWSWPRATGSDLSLSLLSAPNAQRPSSEERSLAVVNPANVAATHAAESENAEQPADPTQASPFAAIEVVTPTVVQDPAIDPTAAPTLIPAIDVGDDATPGGIVLEDAAAAPAATAIPATGQEMPAVELRADGDNDSDEIAEMLAPLLEDQINPTPLVISLEIPAPVPDAEPAVRPLSEEVVRPSSGRTSAFPQVMLLPTATATPDLLNAVDVDNSIIESSIPKVEIVPAVGVRFTPTPLPPPTPTPTPQPQPTPAWVASGTAPGRLWSSFAPLPPERNDHFWMQNPFSEAVPNTMASPNYQFGSTAGNRYRPHHGLDISNPLGTPVQAGVTGEVIHAGPDDPTLLGPYNNFYGQTVVIRLDQRLPVAGGHLDVFVLYGHLNEVLIGEGQRVQPTDVVGLVGMTGIAIGPHLHVEVRLGANTYAHNVNPYLWMKPAVGRGVVAVRLLTGDGRTWAGAKISIARFEGGKAVWARQIETYLDTENIGPDPAWGENGAMGDVPAGYYYLIGNVNGESVRAEFEVRAGETTFVEVRTQQ
jgi:murein DD-endopeptidase MepM/ murein hydrolase activator NlpD